MPIVDRAGRPETGVIEHKRASSDSGDSNRPLKPISSIAVNPIDRLLAVGHRRAVSLVLFVGLAAFANSIGNGFVADDDTVILNNPVIRYLGNPSVIFRSSYWPDPRLELLYRPLVIASYAANYALGGLTAWGYHLVNILLHAVNGTLAYALLWRLFQNKRLALFSALAFALHPIHTEAVANVVGRAELLAAVFIFLSWLAYLTSRDKGGYEQGTLLVSSILCFALALLSKEHAVVLIGALILSDLLLDVQSHPSLSFRDMGRSMSYRLRTSYVWYVSTLVLYLFIRYKVLGALRSPISGIHVLDNPLADVGTVTRILTATKVLGKYLWLLLVPHRLSADYSYNQIPLSRAIWDPSVLPTLLALLLMVIAACMARRRQPVFPFTLLFFGLAILPISNLVFPIGTIMGERLMYLPSLGICLALGAIMDLTLLWTMGRAQAVVALLLVAFGGLYAAYGTKTILRNQVWHDWDTFGVALLTESPNSAKVHRFVGIALARRGDLDKAKAELETALRILPDYPEAYNELGAVLTGQGKFDEALKIFQQAVKLFPEYAEPYLNIGMIYERMGKLAEASEMYHRAGKAYPLETRAAVEIALKLFRYGSLIEAQRQLELAVRVNPELFQVRNNLGLVYLRQDRLEDARRQLQVAARLKPDSPDVWTNLGKVLYRQGQIDRAKSAFEQALRHRPGYAEAKYGLGTLLTREGRLDEALRLIREALQTEPENAEAHNNLGAIYERQGRLNEAEQAFQSAVRIQPDYAEAHNNLGTVYGKQGKLAQARREFEASIRLRPTYAKAHYNLAVLLQQLGKSDDAQRELQLARQRELTPAGAAMPRALP